MRADLRALLQHHHGDFLALLGRELLEPDRRGEPGGAGADNDDVEFHGLAFGHFGPKGLLQFGAKAKGLAQSEGGNSCPFAAGCDIEVSEHIGEAGNEQAARRDDARSDEKAPSDLLAWYEAMGVDEAIGEEPVDALPPPPNPAGARPRRAERAGLPPRAAPGPQAQARRGDRRRSLDACSSCSARRRLRRLRAEAHGEEPLLRAGAASRRASC